MDNKSNKINSLANHYNQLVNRYGNSPKSSQWSDKKTQFKRFDILVSISNNFFNSNILDYGCGIGTFCDYLKLHGFDGNYTGFDISKKALELARSRHKEYTFIEKLSDKKFDYIILSGLFNDFIDNQDDCYQYMFDILISIKKYAIKGITFNCMSSYVDYKDKQLCYFEPEKVFSFCKNKISNRVDLKHSYQVKKNVIPFEFSIYIYL